MFGHILTYLKAKMGDAKGVTIIEYVLMIVLIAIAVAIASPNVTNAVVGVFTTIIGHLTPAAPAG